MEDDRRTFGSPSDPSPTMPPPPPVPGGNGTDIAPTNGVATAALTTGILGIVLFWTIWLGVVLGTLAIVFGAVGRARAKHGAPSGSQAAAGLVLGIVALAFSILFVMFIVAGNVTEISLG